MTDTLSFYANGKLLLTSEYFVLDGAKALALPTTLGQRLDVTFAAHSSSKPVLYWQSFDSDGHCWIESSFDLQGLKPIESRGDDCTILHDILKQACRANAQFLNSNCDIHVKTQLGFSRYWGLGSSSTLISMIAQWANICAYDLLHNTFGGSGYDIACADANKPILYSQKNRERYVSEVDFNPEFRDHLYFIYLNQKQNTRHSLAEYEKITTPNALQIDRLEGIVDTMIEASDLRMFEKAIAAHEDLIAKHLKRSCVKDMLFADYWGAIKSLGAWGGDFILATSDASEEETLHYFQTRGFQTIFKYKDLILNGDDNG